ncbi:GNAT family N-acetyltransferase [Streptomyces sp. HNM0575]|uniref:GNAT family N-acetyltransferase n=1 Tax=Streptomyces sp. HNM0575 TaxID=2716338 RepID=UPI00145CF7DC|nr:GNAT family protein [Streptomyces sp. HNM0575]NLU71157.1 GNAT family N-acetyltransferase [Streptomyces sp. HNM0575]
MFAVPLGEDGAELRPLEPWQAEEFLHHMDRGREFVGQHIGLADAVADLESSRAYLQSYADKTAADTGRIYGIWTPGQHHGAGTLVGGVLFRIMDVPKGCAEVGCWLEPAAAGKGLATRAARVIIDWAVEQRGIHRVEWVVSTANFPSIAVARRLGMTKDGVLREISPYRGKRLDLEVWSILAPEWREVRQGATAPRSSDG